VLDTSPNQSALGRGAYSLGEAARLLRAPARSVTRWLNGYSYRRGNQQRHVAPLWLPAYRVEETPNELSFADLIELRFVHAFVGQGLSL
jgi:hypothetical protein